MKIRIEADTQHITCTKVHIDEVDVTKTCTSIRLIQTAGALAQVEIGLFKCDSLGTKILDAFGNPIISMIKANTP